MKWWENDERGDFSLLHLGVILISKRPLRHLCFVLDGLLGFGRKTLRLRVQIVELITLARVDIRESCQKIVVRDLASEGKGDERYLRQDAGSAFDILRCEEAKAFVGCET